jgi:hypothetical protein
VSPNTLTAWKADYADMLGPIFFGETPAFEEMIVTATDLRNHHQHHHPFLNLSD